VVTRLVADLEEHLGARLVHRTTRRLSLTEAGETYLERVRSILHDIDEADSLASAHTRDLAGVLRVLAPPVLATHVLATGLANFHRRYPTIQVDIEVQSFLVPAIEDFDITLMMTDAAFDAEVIARKIISFETVLVASPNYLKGRSLPIQPADLSKHSYLRMKAPGLHPRVLQLLQYTPTEIRESVEVEPVLWTNHPDILLQAALDGIGITAMSVELVAPHLVSGALVRLLSPWIAGRLSLYAALPSRKFMPQRTRVFLDYLTEQIQLRIAKALKANR
jgi:DNA-binding transcriptional LysR family regulator